MHTCIHIYIYIHTMSLYIYIYIHDSGSRFDSPPTNGTGPQDQALGSRFSELQLPVCTLFAALQSPNPPICALYAPLRSPNFSTYNLYGLFTSLETIYIYKYIWCRFADMCVVSACFSCIQLLLRVLARCCEKLDNKRFTSIQIRSDVPQVGVDDTHSGDNHRARGGPWPWVGGGGGT